ncbi:hypothetical protein QR680_016226 [Steinernema hermaphroditum]|uniref:TIL domain-containing protein n=1 Tax=Steinernema hermaphroditum TaxID=289476 RepID=A0AA39LM96_9BILA|nr:hypothetical protein QR680_016226 [Steinernema hermaphroditum]
MDCGCENTCLCPSVDCSREACGPPGCYCDPDKFGLIHYVRENGTCIGSWQCNNKQYECCPPCLDGETCAIIPQYCPRAPCPPPIAQCQSSTSTTRP